MSYLVRVRFTSRDPYITQPHPNYTAKENVVAITEKLDVAEKTQAAIMQSLKGRHPGRTLEVIEIEWLS